MRSDRPQRGESLHLQIARKIRNDIEAGALRDGEALPSTREMADKWDVSTYTVTEAMKLLANEGVIVAKSRAKRIVNAPNQKRRNEIRLPMPHVLLIGGYAGSGKTELGRIMARLTGWPMLDKDTITRPVLEIALEMLGHSPHDRESDFYLSNLRPREYEALMAAAEENIACGNSAIMTAPFIREFKDDVWLKRTDARFSTLGADMSVVWMHCDAESMHTYVRGRGAARDAGKLGDWSTYLANIEIGFRPSVPHHVVDNCTSGEPLQVQAAGLLETVLGEERS